MTVMTGLCTFVIVDRYLLLLTGMTELCTFVIVDRCDRAVHSCYCGQV